ncbi:MAG: 16S rRNA (guanine(527)-N(7))-methyltransferase RsmG [Eubacteriales bacterium]
MFKDYSELLVEKANSLLNINLSDQSVDELCVYGDMLLEWNQKFNLTSITEPSEVIIKHFVDSLAFINYISQIFPSLYFKYADIGTGAGFPAIPLKIVRPELEIVLIDSLAKRLTFLNEVISTLKFDKISTDHGRVEDFGHNCNYRSSFDLVTARAVAELPVLIEFAVPLLKVGGYFFAAKGSNPEEEIGHSRNALKMLNSEVVNIFKYSLGPKAENRSFVVIKKLSDTLAKYPRKAGIPKKNPL